MYIIQHQQSVNQKLNLYFHFNKGKLNCCWSKRTIISRRQFPIVSFQKLFLLLLLLTSELWHETEEKAINPLTDLTTPPPSPSPDLSTPSPKLSLGFHYINHKTPATAEVGTRWVSYFLPGYIFIPICRDIFFKRCAFAIIKVLLLDWLFFIY